MQYFTDLNYSLGEEDSSVEANLLGKHPGAVVLAVAGSGSRILPLLACSPSKLVCVDVSRWQLALAAMRIALVRELDLSEFLDFMGYTQGANASQRREIFGRLCINEPLRTDAETILHKINWSAPIYAGRFEKMLRRLQQVNSLITGTFGRTIFNCLTLDEQQDYLFNNFPAKRWSLVISLLGNGTVFNSLLYKGEFPRNNTGKSTARVCKEIFKRLFREHLVRRSYFLQLLFFGEICFSDGFPVEATEPTYTAAKKNLANMEPELRSRNIFTALHVDEYIDFCSLSDVPSFLPDANAKKVLQLLRPQLNQGAMVITRAHLRHIAPDTAGFIDRSASHNEVINSDTTGLWQFGIYEKWS